MDYLLTHHGIKGQKWGVRRFQNADGTLTNAGKKRRSKYIRDDGYYTNRGKKRLYSDSIHDLKTNQEIYKVYKDRHHENATKQKAVWDEMKKTSDPAKKKALEKLDREYEMNERILEGGRKAVSKAHETHYSAFLRSMNDPSIKQSQSYKDAEKLVKQYRTAKLKDFVTSGGKKTTNRLNVIVEEGRKHPARISY